MTWKRALLSSAIVLGLLLAGCDTGLSPSGAGTQESNSGTGSVTLNVGLGGISQSAQSAQNVARTVYPTFAGVTYKADFTATSGGTSVLDVTLQDGPNKVELDPGTYTIYVTGTLPLGEPPIDTVIAEKRLTNVTVTTNADTNATAILLPKAAGTVKGTFSYSITVAQGLGLTTGTFTITGTDAPAAVDLTTNSEEPYADDVELAVGSYQAVVTLVRGGAPNQEYAGFSETVYIYAGLTSTLPPELSTFGSGDFSKQVETPVELSASFAKPETDVLPVFAISATNEYTAAIKWTDGDGTELKTGNFKGEEVYTATVTLKAKDGFTFTGIPVSGSGDDAFTFDDAGATVSYPAGGGNEMVITVLFEETAVAEVTELDLTSRVVKPVLAAEPKTDAFANAQYAGTIAWNVEKLTDGKFDGNTAYIATVTLTAKKGFTFAGIGANSFDYTDAVGVSNVLGTDKNMVVIITFEDTAPSQAQLAIEALGFTATEAKASKLDEVTVIGDATISTSTSVPAGITLIVDESKTLTVDGTNVVLTVPTALIVNGSLAATNDGKFATSGQGYVEVKKSTDLAAVIGAAGTSKLDVTLSGAASLGDTVLGSGTAITVNGVALTITGDISGTGSVTATSENSSVVLKHDNPAKNGTNFEWAVKQTTIAELNVAKSATLGTTASTVKPATVVTVADGGVVLTVPNEGSLSVVGDGSLAVTGAGSAVIGSAADKVTLSNVTVTKATGTGSSGKLALAADSTLTFAAGNIKAEGAGTVVIGADSDTITLTKATLAGGTIVAGVLTLADQNMLTLADGGTIEVDGDGAKVATVHADFGEGTYTAAGEVVIASLTDGDTITTATDADNGLSLTTLKLNGQGTASAVYKLVQATVNRVVFGTDSITVNAGASIVASAKASIVLGEAGAIGLMSGATLVLPVDAKIGAFTNDLKDVPYGSNDDGAVGGATIGDNNGAELKKGDDNFLTATTDTVTLTGAASNDSSIVATAVLVAGTDS
jgi:hypothetical protein